MKKPEFIVAPIAAVGLIYSMVVGWFVAQENWTGAAMLFCYGISLLGARIAQLIARK